MKKIALILLLLVITITFCFAKEYNYDGISFEYARGWSFTPIEANKITTISGSNSKHESIQIHRNNADKNVNPKEYLENIASFLIEGYSNSTNKKLKVISKSEITDEIMNGMEVRYVDIFLKGNIYHRVYAFKKNGSLGKKNK
jgi:hypothetical protein